MSKIVGIIQARLGSTRLPNKMLLHLNGFAVVEWVVRRAARAKALHQLIVAIPEGSADDPLAQFLENIPSEVMRGPEQDVLSRFYLAALATGASHIVRICADNPLISWEAIDLAVKHHMEEGADYTYNHVPRHNLWPDGLGAEICTMTTLETLNNSAKTSEHREHVFNYLWDNASSFDIRTFNPPFEAWRRPDIKLDIDTWADYSRMQRLGFHPDMTIDEIIQREAARL